MTLGNSRESLAKRVEIQEGDVALSVRQYNLLIGGLLLWGFLLNFLIVTLLGDTVVEFALNGGYTVILIGYLVCGIIGAVLVNRDNTVTTFIGYNMIAVPVGIVLCVVLAEYKIESIGTAVLFTAIITAAFMVVATIRPNVFRSTAVDLVFAWLGAGLFGLFIGFDWARCNVCACTVNNAVAASANLYLDIINLFLRILRIIGKRKD